jgi:uncharacterized membrane protein
MGRLILLYVATTAVFFGVDIVWLAAIAKDFYRRTLGPLMADPVNWPPAIVFYLLYILGIMVFVSVPAIRAESWTDAVWKGAFLGLIAYATYDLTNFATLKDWPFRVVVVDIVWGMVLTAVVGTASYFIGRAIGA